ncbi:MAG: c-type cytochrome [Armatimonadetes bacterium]|nr:c-type cytochrome [Armatimonadota bacterium]
MRGKILIVCIAIYCLLAVFLGASAENKADGMDKMKMQMMENMKKVMSMKPEQMQVYIMKLQKESLERGKKLFEHPGPTGISCSSCHPKGGTTGGMMEMMPGMRVPIPTLAGASASFPKFKIPSNAVISLEQMHNNCLMMMNKTEPLILGSQEAADLAAYVSSFSNGKTVEIGAHNEMKMDGMKK